LLDVFLRNPNEILGREKLMHDVWDTDFMGDTRTLDVHIRWVREVIEEDPAKPVLLKTVRGKGYIFSVPAGQ
jgi:DNA-binding response OmpR family regulator